MPEENGGKVKGLVTIILVSVLSALFGSALSLFVAWYQLNSEIAEVREATLNREEIVELVINRAPYNRDSQYIISTIQNHEQRLAVTESLHKDVGKIEAKVDILLKQSGVIK